MLAGPIVQIHLLAVMAPRGLLAHWRYVSVIEKSGRAETGAKEGICDPYATSGIRDRKRFALSFSSELNQNFDNLLVDR